MPDDAQDTKGATAASSKPTEQLAIVSFVNPNAVQFSNFPPSVYRAARDIIVQHWPAGLGQEDGPLQVFRLGGAPFSYLEPIHAGRVVTRLFEMLFNAGWLPSSPAMTRDVIFRHQQLAPERCSWMSLYFEHLGALHLIDATTDLIQAVVDLSLQELDLQCHGPCEFEPEVYSLAFRGCPWMTRELEPGTWGTPWFETRLDEACRKTRFLVDLLRLLEKYGWRVYANLDFSVPGGMLGRWYCHRSVFWTPSPPPYEP